MSAGRVQYAYLALSVVHVLTKEVILIGHRLNYHAMPLK